MTPSERKELEDCLRKASEILFKSPQADNSKIHKNPAKALKDAVELRPNDEFISIQLNGSLVTQTYAQIWEGAERRLGGLRSSRLQQGNPIIFQIETSQDFASVLWSCIMGGYIPVPVTLASDYSQPNQALSRLDNIWQQLDDPTILTTVRLASQIHAGLQLYGKKNVKIITIEEIEAHSPDPRLHQLQPDELALLLPSSGTTGKPKLIEVNSQTFIYRFLKNAINQNNDSSEKSFLSWFPLESISGILTTTPNGFQKNIYLPVEFLIRNPLLWLDTLSKHRVTHAQTSNFILARVIDQLRTNPQHDWDFSSVKYIGIGAEPIVAKTARSFLEILAKYNLNPNVLHPAYGMTECGPIAGSREGLSLTAISDSDRFVEIGTPTRGHSIRIVDRQGSILEEGQIGRIQVTGPSMTSGYYKAPELTRELFTEDGWINTGDLGFLKDGKLTITGREKEIVIINARNFSCHEIELVVEEVEGVEPAYTIACSIRQQDSDTDELAIFFHTLIPEESQLAKLVQQIRGKVTQTLGINPTYIITIKKEANPRTATGKIQRLQLKQSLEAGQFAALIQRVDALLNQESEKTFVPPRNELERQLTQIWEKVFGIQTIGIHDNFFNLGGHSLLAVKLFAQIEKTFQINLPLATLFHSQTIADFSEFIETECQNNNYRHQTETKSWSFLVPMQTGGSKSAVFLVPGGHGGVNALINLAKLVSFLGQDQPVYGLQTQGLDGKQKPHTKVEAMAADYIKEIRILQPDGPYLLVGDCIGGIVAFEIAQQLQAQGEEVALLALLDTVAPSESSLQHFYEQRKVATRFLEQLSNNSQLKPTNQILNYFYEEQKAIELLYPNIPEQEARAHYAWVKYFEALVSYKPRRYVGRITLLVNEDYYRKNPPLGWEHLATGGLEIHEVPGSHIGLLEEPNVKVLAERLKVCINKAFTETNTQTKESREQQSVIFPPKKRLELGSSLVSIQTDGSKCPLFCLPSGGAVGVNLNFAKLASLLGSDQPVYGLQQQGLETRQTPLYSCIEELAAHYIKEILTVQPNGPYLLAGLCFGGTVAFEIAHQLRTQGHKVALLALLDSYAPKSSFNRPFFPFEALFYRINFHISNFSQLGLKEKLIYVVERVKSRFNQIAYSLSLRRGRYLPPVLQYFQAEELNGQLLRDYLPQVYPERVTLFRSSSLIAENYFGHDMGWGKLSTGGIEIHKIPGYFGNILSEPQIQVLAEKLRACLDKALDDDREA